MWGYFTSLPFGFPTLTKSILASTNLPLLLISKSQVCIDSLQKYSSCIKTNVGWIKTDHDTILHTPFSLSKILLFNRNNPLPLPRRRASVQFPYSTTTITDLKSTPLQSLQPLHTECLRIALWLPRTCKQSHLLHLQHKPPRVQARAEPLSVAISAEQLEAVVALAVVGMHINGNGARPVTCLLWPVLHAERPGRRYEATVTHCPAMPIPQGVWIMHAPSSERKLTCGLAIPSIV